MNLPTGLIKNLLRAWQGWAQAPAQLPEPTGKLATPCFKQKQSLAPFNQPIERREKIIIMQFPAYMNFTATNKSHSSMWMRSTSVPRFDTFTVTLKCPHRGLLGNLMQMCVPRSP